MAYMKQRDSLDNDGQTEEPRLLKVKIVIQGIGMKIDLSGSAKMGKRPD